MLHRLFAAALCFVGISSSASLAAASDRDDDFHPPKEYYLALGDSLAFGFSYVRYFNNAQPNGFIEPTVFDTGYADDFAAMLRVIRPDVQIVNLSCPGETSTSYFEGGCPYRPLPLHVDYAGAQRDAALAFLDEHRGRVSPITFSMGSNDVLPVVRSLCPTFDPVCVAQFLPPILATLATNLDETFAELREAAPDAELIVVEYYNPFAVVDLASDAFMIELNDVIRSVALRHGARLADAFTPFNRTGDEVATLCALTLMCVGPSTKYGQPDIHPSDLGYGVIAGQVLKASGFSRFFDDDR